MQNRPVSETELLDTFVNSLRERLPEGWKVSLLPQTQRRRWRQRNRRPDGLLRINAPDGSQSVVLIEAKSKLDPKDVPSIVAQARGFGFESIVIAAPYLSIRTRERLAEGGIGYVDSTGNLRLALNRPSLFIDALGAQTSPWSEDRPLRSLKGPAAGRVVRALCDFRPPYGIRELGKRAQIPAPTVARVVQFLDREAIVQREPRGPVTAVDWPALIRRWSQDYKFTESNRTFTYLEPRGLPALLERLRDWSGDYSLTGSLAAGAIAPVAPARLAAIYVRSVGEATGSLGLRSTESGANVLLVDPFDAVVFERTWDRGGLTYVALSQAAADLLTSPGRGPSEGEELITWMSRNEDAWRS